MKAFTDIEQSKKLAKILPIESADMGYIPSAEDDDGNTLYTAEYKSEFIFDEDCIPCWSLAALLDVLPRETRLLKSATDDTYYIDSPNCSTDKWYDNPIDSCVELIENLHNKMVYDFNN